MVKNIWKSYIWTADKDMNESDPRSDVYDFHIFLTVSAIMLAWSLSTRVLVWKRGLKADICQLKR